ncbi:hypothetical protein FDUTEX481_02130 [Tolypothrix sp. PCC 7601]|nr:hypothetical protein FDUTEX481_02130 [Tolypothrix sp. PCC 7601]
MLPFFQERRRLYTPFAMTSFNLMNLQNWDAPQGTAMPIPA